MKLRTVRTTLWLCFFHFGLNFYVMRAISEKKRFFLSNLPVFTFFVSILHKMNYGHNIKIPDPNIYSVLYNLYFSMQNFSEI